MKKYKLIGYRPVGIYYNTPREEIAEYRNGSWYNIRSNKEIVNFVIEKVVEL